jgi:hypothetical protein
MDDPNTTNSSGTHEADEDILTYAVSDEAIEAVANIERGGMDTRCGFNACWSHSGH